VKDISAFEKPHEYSKGFHFVIGNGVPTVENEKPTEARAGKPLYGPGRTGL
jgi:N-acyl-D-amino-acid deacylase